MRRTLDGKDEKTTRHSPLLPPEMPPAQPQSLAGSDVRTFTEEDYHRWVESRRSMRACLEGAGLTKRWLHSKDRSELEGAVLARLLDAERCQPVMESAAESKPCDQEVPEATPTHPSHRELRAARLKERKSVLREAERAGGRLLRVRQRLVSLLMRADVHGRGRVTEEELATALGRVGVALTTECRHALTQALLCEGEEGKVDYRRMVLAIGGRDGRDKNGLVSLLRDYLDRQDSVTSNPNTQSLGPTSGTPPCDEREGGVAQQRLAASTMEGAHGTLMTGCKREQVKQFDALLEYCRSEGVVLNRELVERALLWPSDHPASQCRDHMRQPGLDLLSAHFADPPLEEAPQETRCLREGFGGAYLELRPRSRARTYTPLSTGRAKVEPRVDCWLTYEEFLRLTERIRSRPGYRYKYHGPPKSNAFWPGALLDKLRLCLDAPAPSGGGAPCSVTNIFHPVDPSRVYNSRAGPMPTQVMSWPTNQSGYVQFGSQDRKQYAV
eukprot:Em0001g1628a